MLESAFHPSKANQIGQSGQPGTPGDLVVKSKLSLFSGSADLKQVKSIHQERPSSFFKKSLND